MHIETIHSWPTVFPMKFRLYLLQYNLKYWFHNCAFHLVNRGSGHNFRISDEALPIIDKNMFKTMIHTASEMIIDLKAAQDIFARIA
jgi:hypothetical protein